MKGLRGLVAAGLLVAAGSAQEPGLKSGSSTESSGTVTLSSTRKGIPISEFCTWWMQSSGHHLTWEEADVLGQFTTCFLGPVSIPRKDLDEFFQRMILSRGFILVRFGPESADLWKVAPFASLWEFTSSSVHVSTSDIETIARRPAEVFTTLIRLENLECKQLRPMLNAMLTRRSVDAFSEISPRCLQLTTLGTRLSAIIPLIRLLDVGQEPPRLPAIEKRIDQSPVAFVEGGAPIPMDELLRWWKDGSGHRPTWMPDDVRGRASSLFRAGCTEEQRADLEWVFQSALLECGLGLVNIDPRSVDVWLVDSATHGRWLRAWARVIAPADVASLSRRPAECFTTVFSIEHIAMPRFRSLLDDIPWNDQTDWRFEITPQRLCVNGLGRTLVAVAEAIRKADIPENRILAPEPGRK